MEADLIEEIDADAPLYAKHSTNWSRKALSRSFPKRVMVTGLTLVEINQTFEARILLEPFIINNYMNRIDRKCTD